MIYPIAVHKDKQSHFGVTVPDLPGCFSAGTSLVKAQEMAKEAIALHVEGLIAKGTIPPAGHTIEQHAMNPDYQGATWALVNVEK